MTTTLEKARDVERTHLLTTFAVMAIAREERSFVESAALSIFKAGFCLKLTLAEEELVSLRRAARDQLVNVCNRHPYVMSVLLKEFSDDKKVETCREVRAFDIAYKRKVGVSRQHHFSTASTSWPSCPSSVGAP